jgi:hypothetical protein
VLAATVAPARTIALQFVYGPRIPDGSSSLFHGIAAQTQSTSSYGVLGLCWTVNKTVQGVPESRTPSVPHQTNVKPIDTVQSVRTHIEKIRLDLIASQIETARALASTAQTLYDSGSKAHAHTADDRAWEAYESADTKLKDINVGRELRNDFIRKLREVRAMLDAAPFEKRKRQDSG